MKDYLNRRERTNWLFLLSLIGRAQEVIEEMGQHNADKTVLKYLRSSSTLMNKAIQQFTQDVSSDALMKLYSEANRVTLALIFNREAEAHTRRMIEEDRAMHQKVINELGPDVIQDMAEIVMASACRKCDGSIKQNCWIHETFQKLQIPEWDDSPELLCEYSGAGSSEVIK